MTDPSKITNPDLKKSDAANQPAIADANITPAWIGEWYIILVGLMGAGKSNLGKRIANATSLPFKDSDREIEIAADASISEIFEKFGETYFRDGERRVIARLLGGEQAVIATGGGAYMDENIRSMAREKAISVWLRADIDLLVSRTSRRTHRPLLNTGNPRQILQNLIDLRYPIYELADVIVDVNDEPAAHTANRVLAAIRDFAEKEID